jgi:hypothetical protein
LRDPLRVSIYGSLDEINPPLPSNSAPEACVEQVLIEQDQVARFCHNDL